MQHTNEKAFQLRAAVDLQRFVAATDAVGLELPVPQTQCAVPVPTAGIGDLAHVHRPNGIYRRLGKRILDIVVVLATLPLTGPLIALSALALWIEGGAPIYTQDRLGRSGRIFRLFKLRTMTRDAEARLDYLLATDTELNREWYFTQKLKNDPRITPIGRFLRSSSIDELPQILNVLKGEMSLVGPRPMMPDQLKLYGDAGPYFAVNPGLSGFWQIKERNDSTFGYRAIADKAYVETVSLRVDLAVLWKTIWVVMRRTGH